MGDTGDTMDWAQALDAWATEQAASGLAETTIRLRDSHLRAFAREHPDPWAVDHGAVIRWMAGHAWAPETRRSNQASLRGFFSWAAARKLIPADPCRCLRPVRIPPPCPRPAPDEVITQALVTTTREDVAMMLSLAAVAGLRRIEVSRAHTQDLVGRLLHVMGKGRRERDVPLTARLAARIHTTPPGWLFPSPVRPGQHLTPGHVGRLMSRALPGRWTAHTLRHAAATAWADQGLDLDEIGELLGHSSAEITRRYVARPRHRTTAAVEAAATRLSPGRHLRAVQ